MGGLYYRGPWAVSPTGCAGHWSPVSSELGFCDSHLVGVTRGRAMPFRPRPHPRPTDRGRLVTTPLPLHNRSGRGHGREPEGAAAPVPNRAAGTSGLHCTRSYLYTAVYLGGAAERSPRPGVDVCVHPGAGEEAFVCTPPSTPPPWSPRPLHEHQCSSPRLGALRGSSRPHEASVPLGRLSGWLGSRRQRAYLFWVFEAS